MPKSFDDFWESYIDAELFSQKVEEYIDKPIKPNLKFDTDTLEQAIHTSTKVSLSLIKLILEEYHNWLNQ